MNQQQYQQQPYIPPPPPQYYYVPQQPEKDDKTKLIVIGSFALIGLGLLGYGAYTLSGMAEKKAQDKLEEKISNNDTDAQIVMMLYDLIYPTMFHGEYGRGTTGEDAQKLLHVASQINDFAYVKSNYALVGKGKGRNLLNDLQAQLEGADYNEFIQRATKKKQNRSNPNAGATVEDNPNAGVNTNIPNKTKTTEHNGSYKEVWTGRTAMLSAAANIRTEPKKGDNILVPMKEVMRGHVIGLLTGKVTDSGYVEIFVRFNTDQPTIDQKPYINLIQKKATGFVSLIFGTDYKKLIKEKGILVYVHKDYIFNVTKANKKGSQGGYSDESTEVSLKGGRIASRKRTAIYDENLRGIGLVEKDIMLGELLYTLENGKNNKAMHAFRTAYGTRWVNSEDSYLL